jgi:Kyakuja-Dileera-Zisupton transposase
MPASLRPTSMPLIQCKVPKFHLPAHRSDCHSRFSFNFTRGVGRTDGEGVERNWSWLNGTAASTSQMGPGSRMDTLDDFMGFYNHQKVVNLGKL